VRTDGNHPAGRFAGTLITDTERGRLLLFGGEADNGAKSDVWALVETVEPQPETAEPQPETAEPQPEADQPELDAAAAPESAAPQAAEEPSQP
jgi:hypothetical protein